jgi:DNA-directed RNA polymerase specialized sigma subunit
VTARGKFRAVFVLPPAGILSLEEALPECGEESKSQSRVDTIEYPEGSDPLKEHGYQDTKRILKETIALYHSEELTHKEIGEALGLAESRVPQIHGKAWLFR